MAGFPWGVHYTEVLTEMWGAGRTGGQIAAALNAQSGLFVSRQAVIGKARRLGLASRMPQRANKSDFGFAEEKKKAKAEPIRIITVPIPDRSKTIIIWDLARRHCRFPVTGEGIDIAYCGHDRMEPAPYCDYHTQICERRHVSEGRHAV